VTFADKTEHQLFLEPEGEDTQEYYLNGFSSSLPIDVQIRALQSIPALRDVQIYRPGYAIEYDFFDPTQLYATLETKLVSGLYFAGQINGTTGYEEAAGQGLIAGANAALKAKGRGEFVLKRDQAYIGVLIDDLITKGVDEPYRMFTSRAEYRILLRQDDADMRLTPLAHEVGLVDDERYAQLVEKQAMRDRLIDFAREYSVKAGSIDALLEEVGSTPMKQGQKLIDLVKRPQLTIEVLSKHIPALAEIVDAFPANRREEIVEAAEVLLKYEGYIERERQIADKIKRLERITIDRRFDYNTIKTLSTEARQKLSKIRPETIAQASRIPGVSPSDINILLLMMGR
jgi:tRNA uridine 5-carboxymethylaminomethyl modification enzyme